MNNRDVRSVVFDRFVDYDMLVPKLLAQFTGTGEEKKVGEGVCCRIVITQPPYFESMVKQD